MRNTVQKEIILAAVRGMKNHPSADEIYKEISKSHPTISRGTVYRNLSVLSDMGEIKRVAVANAPDRFDFNLSEHYHAKCNLCGRVFDYPARFSIEPYTEADGFTVDGYDLVINGVCKSCKS